MNMTIVSYLFSIDYVHPYLFLIFILHSTNICIEQEKFKYDAYSFWSTF